jgi:ribose transport system ATP-binding protein
VTESEVNGLSIDEPVERSTPALAMQSVAKRFGPTVALDGVDLSIARGEIHALIGENGAGKSTLMKLLAGALAPDAGRIFLDGRVFAPSSPSEARRNGVAMIHQELTLAAHLTVEANVLLGMEDAHWGFVRRREHERRVREALTVLGHPGIDPRAPVSSLGMGEMQLVEIARALVARARILVLDEPTSSLSVADAERLFQVIARLAGEGVSVIYISHFLEEVYRVCHRYTVLRNGKSVGTGAIDGTPATRIVELMVGRSLSELFPARERHAGAVLLSLESLRGRALPRGIDLELRRGEVLGLAGLVGAGRTETLRAIYGLDPVTSGRVRVSGVSSARSSPRQRIAQGVGFLSENRKEEGLALSRTITENTTLSRLEPVSRRGWIRRSAERSAVAAWIDRLGIKCFRPEQLVGELSGGNQQKVALARLLHQDADVLLLDEPTRGIDIGSKVEIYRRIGELAATGKAVLFVSSYIPELLGVCDRVAVLARGELRAIRPASDWTEHEVLLAATGGLEAA